MPAATLTAFSRIGELHAWHLRDKVGARDLMFRHMYYMVLGLIVLFCLLLHVSTWMLRFVVHIWKLFGVFSWYYF